MNNYKFKLAIDAADIYNKLLPEQKDLFNDVKIMNVESCGDKRVIIECLVLEKDIEEVPFVQKIIDDGEIRVF